MEIRVIKSTKIIGIESDQGVVEGINQKIKLIKRRAYGLTNFESFRRRVLLNWHFSYQFIIVSLGEPFSIVFPEEPFILIL